MFINDLSHSGFSAGEGQFTHEKPNVVILKGVCEESVEPTSKLCSRWSEALGSDVNAVEIDPLSMNKTRLDAALSRADGIFLPGGNINVHPKHYGEDPIDQRLIWGDELPAHCFCDAHYEAAKHMVEYADGHDVPILGVCLGAQIMNVARGGRLQQVVEKHDQGYLADEGDWDAVAHRIEVMRGGMLAGMMGVEGLIDQNSVHRQGFRRNDLGQGLDVDAMADDGFTVEAISDPRRRFFFAAQFHAETSLAQSLNARIFAAFSAAAWAFSGAEEYSYSRPDSQGAGHFEPPAV